MALARMKVWASGEVLASSDLNSEFQNLIDNARDLISPLTASLDMNGFELVLDADADSSLTIDTDDRLDIRLFGVDLFVFNGVAASLVNGITFTGAATGSGASVASTGSDTNIPITVAGKGTGHVILGQATSTDVRLAADQPIADSSGNELVKFSKTASAVNEVTVTNAATGGAPVISATGGDTNIPLRLTPKGTGDVQFTDGTDTTKIVAFELSGLTTGSTRTLTVPDASITLAGTNLAQSFTAIQTVTTPANDVTPLVASKTSSTVMTSIDTPIINVISSTATADSVFLKFQGSGTHVNIGIKKATSNFVIRQDITGTPVDAITVDTAGNVTIPDLKNAIQWGCVYNTVTSTTNLGSFNVSSLTDNGTGDTTVNLSITMATQNVYGITNQLGRQTNCTATTSTTARFVTSNQAFALEDEFYVSVGGVGEQA